MRSMRTPAILAALMLVALAFTAPTASALQFTAAKYPVNFLGHQDVSGIHKFEVEKQLTECKQANMEAMGVGAARTTLNLTTVWQLKAGECPVVMGFSAVGTTREVDPEGCTFELLEPVGAPPKGNMAIRCPAGKSIKLRGASLAGTCEVRIGEANNTALAGVTYTNLGGAPSKFSAKFAITGITANKVVDFGTCGLTGVGVINTVAYTGTSVFEGSAGIGVEIK